LPGALFSVNFGTKLQENIFFRSRVCGTRFRWIVDNL
jgi:hypothetical protein